MSDNKLVKTAILLETQLNYFNFIVDRITRQGHCQVGSLAGAAHLLNGNAGVLRRAQQGQKPCVEQKGKSSFDLDFQYKYKPRNRGLSILYLFIYFLRIFKLEVSEKLPQG